RYREAVKKPHVPQNGKYFSTGCFLIRRCAKYTYQHLSNPRGLLYKNSYTKTFRPRFRPKEVMINFTSSTISYFSWRVQSKGSLGANAAEKGNKTLQKRRQRSQDIELLW